MSVVEGREGVEVLGRPSVRIQVTGVVDSGPGTCESLRGVTPEEP